MGVSASDTVVVGISSADFSADDGNWFVSESQPDGDGDAYATGTSSVWILHGIWLALPHLRLHHSGHPRCAWAMADSSGNAAGRCDGGVSGGGGGDCRSVGGDHRRMVWAVVFLVCLEQVEDIAMRSGDYFGRLGI